MTDSTRPRKTYGYADCSVCETRFMRLSSRNRYCTPACAASGRRALLGVPEPRDLVCPECSTRFASKNRSHTFCSENCRDRARYRRAQADPAKAAARRAASAAWRKRNPQSVRDSQREWKQRNSERVKEASREWARANKHRIQPFHRRDREGHNAYARLRTKRLRDATPYRFSREQVIARLAFHGSTCWMCGRVADTVDHVKPLTAGGLNIPANLRPACRPCNSSKGNRWHGVQNLFLFLRE